MEPAQLSVRHARAILFLTAALTLLGVWAYFRTPAAIFPDMHFSRIDVVAETGNLPPEQVRVAMATPLERAFLGLPSVRRVRTTSALGSAEAIVEFDPKTDAERDLQYVDDAIARTRDQLPAGANVAANVVTPQTEPVLSYGLTSSTLSQTIVREYAERNILPALYGTPGLARILTVGGPQREYHVELDRAALAAAGLSATDVANAIGGANDVAAVGIAQNANQRRTILVDAGLHDLDGIGDVVVPVRGGYGIPVRALGAVRLGVAPAGDEMSVDARRAVGLSFFALPGADTVALGREIRAGLDAAASRLPAGVTLHRYWDATELIVASQESLRDAIFVGALLALGVIFFFLRNIKMTLVAAAVIPSALAIAILAISLMGQTLNIMSVGALAIAVGLIIDDAIVVIEGIAARGNVVEAMRRLIAPMAASTLTTVVVFLPLTLLGGVSGAFFRTLALTLASALLVSLGLALFVTPILVRAALGQEPAVHGNDRVERTLERYEPLLAWALAHRRGVVAIAGGVLIATAAILAFLPSDFLPHMDEGQFEIAYAMPVGTSLAASDAAATAMERTVLADPAVATEGRMTGVDTNGYSPTPVRAGFLRVKLRDGPRDSFDAVADRLRDAIGNAVPAATLDVHQILEDIIDDISGAPSPIEVVIGGPDQSTLVDAATRLATGMGKVPGIADAFSGVEYEEPTVRVRPNTARLARTGADSSDLAAAIAAETQGSIGTSVTSHEIMVPVRIAVAGQSDALPESVALGGGSIPLATLAQTRVDRSATDVNEIDGRRVLVVTANVSGASLSTAVAGVRAAIARVGLPPGYRADIEGAYRAQQDSFAQFASVIGVAAVLVFFVMLVAFGSFRLPLVILAAVPLAPIGAAVGLALTGTPFNVSSFMGLLLLVGLVVKNGILLVDAANRRRREGDDIDRALALAGRERLRPILMTTFAAIGGLLPLAFGIGTGSAMERPLAIAVVGGLCTSTFFTLLLVPVLYAAVAPRETTA